VNFARWQLVASALPLLLWLVSLVDALRFHADARDYFAHSGCLDAANDLSYAGLLLAATGFGTTLALLQTSTWLRRHRAMWSLGMLLVGGFGVAFHHCVAIEPIVHFASGFEVALLWFGVGSLYASALLFYLVVTLVRPVACTPRRQPVSRRAGDAAAACAETQSDEPAAR
jgi:hypothetical protein